MAGTRCVTLVGDGSRPVVITTTAMVSTRSPSESPDVARSKPVTQRALPTPARQERQQVEKEVVDIQVDGDSQHDRLTLGGTLDPCHAIEVIDKKCGKQNCRNRSDHDPQQGCLNEQPNQPTAHH